MPAAGASVVYVIDDDESVRRALTRQLRTAGYVVEAFSSAQDFLDAKPSAELGCIVTDLRMPGISGLDLQTSLEAGDRRLPMIFVSGHGDVSTSVRAMRAGAIHFLSKPFTEEEILGAVAEALALGERRAAERSEASTVEHRHASLTPREREVFALVVAGLANKIIADRLGAAEKTIKIHRGRVMHKMGARSLADLVRMAARLHPSA